MKYLHRNTAIRMSNALVIATLEVRHGAAMGLCEALGRNIFLRPWEKFYLQTWIGKMVGRGYYLEKHLPNLSSYERQNPEYRYRRRIRWVKWMINHLKETT